MRKPPKRISGTKRAVEKASSEGTDLHGQKGYEELLLANQRVG